MTKSTITRERLAKIKSWRETYGAGSNVMLPAEEAEELARMALAAMDSEPVAYIFKHPAGRLFWSLTDKSNKGHDDVMPVYASPQPAPIVEREPIAWLNDAYLARGVVDGEAGSEDAGPGYIPVYRHAQPAPVVPKSISVRQAISALESADAVTTIGQAYKIGWNACRAAMLQELKKSAGSEATCRSNENAQVLTSINPAPALVSLQKNAKSMTGNSPVIGIDLVSGPDRTVEVHYVVPPGYVMVPKEPTDEMITAAMNCEDVLFNSDDSFCVQFVNIYEAMLAAAPKEVK